MLFKEINIPPERLGKTIEKVVNGELNEYTIELFELQIEPEQYVLTVIRKDVNTGYKIDYGLFLDELPHIELTGKPISKLPKELSTGMLIYEEQDNYYWFPVDTFWQVIYVEPRYMGLPVDFYVFSPSGAKISQNIVSSILKRETFMLERNDIETIKKVLAGEDLRQVSYWDSAVHRICKLPIRLLEVIAPVLRPKQIDKSVIRKNAIRKFLNKYPECYIKLITIITR